MDDMYMHVKRNARHSNASNVNTQRAANRAKYM
jgi:hypothetical protein